MVTGEEILLPVIIATDTCILPISAMYTQRINATSRTDSRMRSATVVEKHNVTINSIFGVYLE